MVMFVVFCVFWVRLMLYCVMLLLMWICLIVVWRVISLVVLMICFMCMFGFCFCIWLRMICDFLLGEGQLMVRCIMKWFSCVLGRVQVFLYLMGFDVVMIWNGCGSGKLLFLMVIWFFVIVLSIVDWVLGVVWFILLVRSSLVKIGLGWNMKLFVDGVYMYEFVIFLGSMLGVYCS